MHWTPKEVMGSISHGAWCYVLEQKTLTPESMVNTQEAVAQPGDNQQD